MSDIKRRTVPGGEIDEKKEGEHNHMLPIEPEDLEASSTTPAELARRGITLIGFLILVNFLVSFLVTDSFTWGYQNGYTNWRNYLKKRNLVFTEKELSKYDGTNPNLPIYIAINGEVYDVTDGKDYYGKGGGYHFFSGRDAARAYVTGCFKTHLTHDLRGFDDIDMEQIVDWQEFYRNHHTYYKIGKVLHDPINPNSPLPVDCKENGKRRTAETIQSANKK